VWASGRAGTTESLRVHVNQLRNKLGEGPFRPVLVTEPGVGYRLLEPGALPDGPRSR
jgi:DNA-binding response OmpR family regulator